MEGKEWQFKPSKEFISSLRSASDLSTNLANKDVLIALGNLTRDYPKYRIVKADGNCLYRAIAFNWIKESGFINFEEVFPMCNNLSLDSCQTSSVPKEFQKFYQDDFIKSSFKAGWEIIFRNSQSKNKEERFIKALNKYKWLDFLIVNYFRCLAAKTLQKYPETYKNFSRRGIQGIPSDIQRVSTFGQESQIIQINVLANILKSDIQVYSIGKNGIKIDKYHAEIKQKKQALLLQNKHFDILCSASIKNLSKQKVQFKMENQIMNDKEIDSRQSSKSSKSKSIIKKGSSKYWKSTYSDNPQESFDLDTSIQIFIQNSFKITRMFCLILVVGLLLACAYKSSRISATIHRNYWPWRQEYVSYEIWKHENKK